MNIKYAITILLFISTCLISCGGESSNAPASEEDSKGSEIPCDEQNEGLIIKPADSETDRLCKDGAWVELSSSSESVSSSSDVSSSSLEASSSSITSSSSSLDISSSSSAGTEEQVSSSSEETKMFPWKMFLCEDGVTYVLDLVNCDAESSSSDALSSSSEEDSPSPLSSSSSVVSSSSEQSSNSVESSSATLSSGSEDSSSSENVSSSSSSATSSSSERSSSSVNIGISSCSENTDISSSSIGESSSSLNSIYDAANNTLTDLRDGQVYKTVTIDSQIWMAENLNYLPEDTVGTIYSGGTVCGGGEEKSKIESQNCDEFGRLYLRKVALYQTDASNRQGICPDGWGIPQKKDWEKLVEFLGENAAEKLKMDGTTWSTNPTNESGFSALKACNYNSILNQYVDCSAYFFYWNSSSDAYFFRLYDKSINAINYAYGQPPFMFSVRCLKEE